MAQGASLGASGESGAAPEVEDLGIGEDDPLEHGIGHPGADPRGRHRSVAVNESIRFWISIPAAAWNHGDPESAGGRRERELVPGRVEQVIHLTDEIIDVGPPRYGTRAERLGCHRHRRVYERLTATLEDVLTFVHDARDLLNVRHRGRARGQRVRERGSDRRVIRAVATSRAAAAGVMGTRRAIQAVALNAPSAAWSPAASNASTARTSSA